MYNLMLFWTRYALKRKYFVYSCPTEFMNDQVKVLYNSELKIYAAKTDKEICRICILKARA